MTRSVITIAALVAAGLVAGLMLGTGISDLTARTLAAGTWLLRFQAEDRLFSKIMPPFFLATLLLQVAAAGLSQGSERYFFGLSAVLFVAVILITVSGELPLNRLFQSWSEATMTSDWAAMRDRWLKLHLVRTLLGITAFVCAAVGLIRTR